MTLTPQGNFLIGGNNPNNDVNLTVPFSSEFRLETLNPPFMSVARPVIKSAPEKIGFVQTFTVPVTVPANIKGTTIQGQYRYLKCTSKPDGLATNRTKLFTVALMDLGFSTHAFHSSARLVFMDAKLSANRQSLTMTAPPNRNIFPPGPGWIFLTMDGVTSVAQRVMVGSGASPPQTD